MRLRSTYAPAAVILVVVWAVLAVLPGEADTSERTSENDPKLSRWLVRFPQADANADGILTLNEAKAYRDQVARQKRRDRQVSDETRAGKRLPPTHADMAYGPHDRNVLDLWLPKTVGTPVPLVVFIHGGGFVGGNKTKLHPTVLNLCLERGIAVAAINYRLVTTNPFPAPFLDGARAVQHLRYKAADLKLDPARFAVFGGSAGAGIAMWIGYHDDLADPDSSDAVARQSSRVCAVGSIGGQSTYVPAVARAWVGDGILAHPSLRKIYGVSSVDELLSPDEALAQLMTDCSPIDHVTPEDPPLIMFYPEHAKGLAHNIAFGREMKRALESHGILAVLNPVQRDGQPEALIAFFADAFGIEQPGTHDG
jgi:acetyl esterase/lipase